MSITTVSTFNSNIRCSLCSLQRLCLPYGVDKQDIAQLEKLVESAESKQKGRNIFKQGDEFEYLYAVKSGCLKSSRVDESGHEQIIAFHLPGEIVGLDGIYPNQYSCTTTALDTTALCELDFQKLSGLCRTIPALQTQLLRLLSRDIYESHVDKADKAEQTAEQKLASFIMNLSVRLKARGYPALVFSLPMSKRDIANFIGVTPETVSRILKQFKQRSIVSIEVKTLSILDIDALKCIIE